MSTISVLVMVLAPVTRLFLCGPWCSRPSDDSPNLLLAVAENLPYPAQEPFLAANRPIWGLLAYLQPP